MSKTPSLFVGFLDELGHQKGGRGFIFLLIIAVFKVKSTLNELSSSWGYLKNIKNSQKRLPEDEELIQAEEIKSEDVLNKKDLITIYYMTLKYIDFEIKLLKGTEIQKDKDVLEIQLCLLGITKNHEERCTNKKCYCKTQERILKGREKHLEILKRGFPKDTFDEKFTYLRNTTSIKIMIEFLEQQFENYIRFHGQGDDEVLYPYIKFLMLYSGKICRAIILLNQKRELVKQKN